MSEPVSGTLIVRNNRFAAQIRLDGGVEVKAYVPNTSRLRGLFVPGCRVLVTPNDDPKRATDWTVGRVVVGDALVALEANAASDMVARLLDEARELPGLGAIASYRREVAVAGHRLDFALTLASGEPAWLEVKSLSIADGRTAIFSRTPSKRGRAHLAALAELVEAGTPAAAAFVVQRGDVDQLAADDGADPGWLEAVRDAAARGVHILAFRSRVTPTEAWIDGPIPVVL